jgi:hypothetical protein
MEIKFIVKTTPALPVDFGLQLKIQQKNPSYGAHADWSWDSGNSRLDQHQLTGTLSYAMMFVSIPTDYLNGKKIKVDWQGQFGWDWGAYWLLMDGQYDATSQDDFPHTVGTWCTEKGAGQLYSYYTGSVWSFAREVRDSGVLDLSSSQLDYVTYFLRVLDTHNTYEGHLYVYDIQVTDADDNVLNSIIKGGTVDVTDDGNWDYGTYS